MLAKKRKAKGYLFGFFGTFRLFQFFMQRLILPVALRFVSVVPLGFFDTATYRQNFFSKKNMFSDIFGLCRCFMFRQIYFRGFMLTSLFKRGLFGTHESFLNNCYDKPFQHSATLQLFCVHRFFF